jgi:hypothetical protein
MREFRRGVFAISSRTAFVLAGALSACLLGAGCGSSSGAGTTSAPRGATHPSTSTSSSTTTTLAGLPQPTDAKPLTILDIGDSLGEDLGIGEEDTLGTNPLVKVLQDAVGDTGLARPDYYNWPANLEAELQKYHPQVVTILVGGNDAQNFLVNNQAVVFGTAEWHTIYSQRVAQMMNETHAAGAKMLWVGLPIMQDPQFGASMQMLNAIYQAQAATHPGVEFMPTWKLFSNADGQYTTYLTNSAGQTVVARDSDGVHIAPPGGCEIVAQAAIKDIEQLWHISVGV